MPFGVPSGSPNISINTGISKKFYPFIWIMKTQHSVMPATYVSKNMRSITVQESTLIEFILLLY